MKTETETKVRNLRVSYEGPKEAEMEDAVKEAIKPFGFRFWASNSLISNDQEESQLLAFDDGPYYTRELDKEE